MEKVLAIDPGTSRMGYAILTKNSGEIEILASGCIESPKNLSRPKKFLKIKKKLTKLIKKHQPEKVVIEDLFFTKNAKTVIAVSQSQGVVIVTAAENDLGIKMISPLHIKQTLTGYGRAGKKQVQQMVKRLLDLDEVPKPDDTADAIACGLTYFNTNYDLK